MKEMQRGMMMQRRVLYFQANDSRDWNFAMSEDEWMNKNDGTMHDGAKQEKYIMTMGVW